MQNNLGFIKLLVFLILGFSLLILLKLLLIIFFAWILVSVLDCYLFSYRNSNAYCYHNIWKIDNYIESSTEKMTWDWEWLLLSQSWKSNNYVGSNIWKTNQIDSAPKKKYFCTNIFYVVCKVRDLFYIVCICYKKKRY